MRLGMLWEFEGWWGEWQVSEPSRSFHVICVAVSPQVMEEGKKTEMGSARVDDAIAEGEVWQNVGSRWDM